MMRRMNESAPALPITAATVVDHWFGELNPDGTPGEAALKRWWGKNPTYDAWLTEHFGPVLKQLAAGELEDWQDSPQGTLGYIIVADQMSRNIHRGSGHMYDADPRALAATRRLIDSGAMTQLIPTHRYFALMPLMHAEDLALQQECIERFETEAAGVEGGLHKSFAGGADYARKHAVIVERFGRFPHRNELLGRTSTTEEVAFLKTPGSSF